LAGNPYGSFYGPECVLLGEGEGKDLTKKGARVFGRSYGILKCLILRKFFYRGLAIIYFQQRIT
jgi:hypothetical protein